MDRYSLLSAVFQIPATASNSYLGKAIIGIGKLVREATILLMGAALLVFLWGVAKFIFKAGDKGAVEEGRNFMMWGVIALFVMVATWGLVRLLEDAFGFTPRTTINTGSSNINLPRSTSATPPCGGFPEEGGVPCR